eukprot:scaffold1449_cov108-Isochrysis_galbana.AAC.7
MLRRRRTLRSRPTCCGSTSRRERPQMPSGRTGGIQTAARRAAAIGAHWLGSRCASAQGYACLVGGVFSVSAGSNEGLKEQAQTGRGRQLRRQWRPCAWRHLKLLVPSSGPTPNIVAVLVGGRWL